MGLSVSGLREKKQGLRPTLTPLSRSSLDKAIRSLSRPPPSAMTYTSVSLPRTFSVLFFCLIAMMLYTRSTPTLTPTHGTGSRLLPAASANMLTRLSYRPPAAMEPTPTDDSSTASGSAAAAASPAGLPLPLDLDLPADDDDAASLGVVLFDAGTAGVTLAEGGAESSVMAS